MKSLNLHIVKLAGIALLGALAISLGVGERAVHAQTLYGLAHSGPNEPSTLYTIDTNTGAAIEVGPTGFNRCSGMDFNASGTLFATCERADESDTHVLIIIDTGIGIGAEVGPTNIELLGLSVKTATDISFRNSDGALFAYLRTNIFFDFLATIDIAVGSTAAKLVGGPTLTLGTGNAIAFSPLGELFHADELRLNTLNQVSGQVIPGPDLLFPSLPDSGCCDNPRVNAMDFQPGTEILFASLNDKLSQNGDPENFLATIETIGVTAGEVTIIGPTVAGLDAIAFAPVAVAAAPPQAELGNLKCYDAKWPEGTPTYEEVEVSLEDEFDPYPKITRVKKPARFCTPVSKDDAEIPDPTARFTCYKIKNVREQPEFEGQDVVVNNQFGNQQAMTLKKPKLLCVPSTIVQ